MQYFVPYGDGPGAWLLRMLLDVFQFCLLARMILAWLYPRSTHPVVTLLELVTEPILRQVRQVVPPVGQFDLSAVFVFLLVDIIKWLLALGGGWLV